MEHTLAAIAQGLVRLGVRQLLVGGGETSGDFGQGDFFTRAIEALEAGPMITAFSEPDLRRELTHPIGPL